MILYKDMDELNVIELEILSLAQKGHSRVEFKRNASALICDYFSCSGLDIYIREGNIDYTWITRREADSSFSFNKAQEGLETTQEYRRIADSENRSDQKTIIENRDARMIIPIAIDETRSGLIVYFRNPEKPFALENLAAYMTVSKIFGKAVFFRNSQSALHERIKELSCLYEITRIMHMSQGGIEETLTDVVKIIPLAFQYEDSATSSIILDGQKYVSSSVNTSGYSLKSEIMIANSERGYIEVSYLTSGGDLEEKPFLLEEQNLLDSIAKQLSLLIEEQEAAVEKLRLEDQLRHADRLATIGQLAAGVAHEINEPLANILGFSELIKRDSSLTQQTSSDIDKIIRASMYARETVKKLLIFAGKIQPGEMEIDFNTIITEGLQFLEYRCNKNNIEVQTELDQEIPAIIADPGQINQIFINLLVNSIQALPDGGEIKICSGTMDDTVFLSVEDNGTGIPEEIRERIFLPFFTTKGIGEGTGLGLVVVHGIVQAYKGKIEVQSSIGKYTRFTVHLPIKDSHE